MGSTAADAATGVGEGMGTAMGEVDIGMTFDEEVDAEDAGFRESWGMLGVCPEEAEACGVSVGGTAAGVGAEDGGEEAGGFDDGTVAVGGDDDPEVGPDDVDDGMLLETGGAGACCGTEADCVDVVDPTEDGLEGTVEGEGMSVGELPLAAGAGPDETATGGTGGIPF